MQKFLEDKGVTVMYSEGNDFFAVFRVSADDRAKITSIRGDIEKETGLYVAVSDMGGSGVIIMENKVTWVAPV